MRGTLRAIIPVVDTSIITLEVRGTVDESLINKDLSIDLKLYKEKRSLSANAYFHVLCSQLAKAVGCSLTEMKNRLIADYGQYQFTPRNGSLEIDTVLLRDDIEWTRVQEMHLSPTADTFVVDGIAYSRYWVMRGSHTYDSAEMAELIDGTCSECKQVGIRTLEDEEIERMVKTWQGQS